MWCMPKVYDTRKSARLIEYRLGQRSTESTTEAEEIDMESRQSSVIEEEMTRRLYKVTVPVWRSVSGIRLVETENPSACATVSRKVCKSAIALYGL
jgi:hypothetical protein